MMMMNRMKMSHKRMILLQVKVILMKMKKLRARINLIKKIKLGRIYPYKMRKNKEMMTRNMMRREDLKELTNYSI